MTVLRGLSIFWSLAHTIVMIFILFESRYSKKKTMTITFFTMLPLIILNCIISLTTDVDKLGATMLFTLTIPMAVFFFILAKRRGGRYLFTFFSVDTVVLELFYITQIINFYTTPDTYIVMFISRLLIYPFIEWVMYKKLRVMYLDVQRNTKISWKNYATISIIFHILFTLFMTVPGPIISRPEYYPAMTLLFILMPFVYVNIISTLQNHRQLFEITEQENILKVQVADIKSRVEEFSAANDKFRTERHDFRHKLQTISRMIENKEYDELRNVVAKYGETIEETKVKRYCENAVLDAVFSSYLHRAESKGIVVTSHITLPKTLPVSDVELATVFANAIENAIHACEKLEPEKRYIDLKVITKPNIMIQIENSFNGKVELDKNGVPVTHKEGHGFGTRSIIAFCDKNNAFYEFKTNEDKFALRIVF